MTVIGLTGGIASGKSTAAGWMRDLGAIVIDADRLGHRVYEPGTSGFQAVVNEFGHDLVQADGSINRQLLGGRVFGDPEQMKRLTDIVWPEIRRLAHQEVTELKRRDPKAAIVLEAAVLVEANWFDLVDEVWVVTVDPAIARARLMARNSLTEAQAQARIDSQISNKERALLAFVKIDNSGTLDEFHQTVDKEWKKLARRGGFVIAPATPAPATSAASKKVAASKATAISKVASKAAARPVTKAAAAPSKANAVKASTVKAAPAKASAAKPAVKSASAARVAVKAAPARASAVQAVPARATTRSASTQSASTRTAAARPAASRASAIRTTASRVAVAPATRTATKATSLPAVRRPVVKPAAAKLAAKPAARPVTGRRAAAK